MNTTVITISALAVMFSSIASAVTLCVIAKVVEDRRAAARAAAPDVHPGGVA